MVPSSSGTSKKGFIMLKILWCLIITHYCASTANPILIFIQGNEWSCKKPIVEITVSPLVTEKTIRVLDVSWDVSEVWSDGDWIGLYTEPPTSKSHSVFNKTVISHFGWARTGIQEGRQLTEANYTKKCLGYWTAYWKQQTEIPVATNCLRTNPRWMQELKKELGRLKLTDTFFPGTHDSGAFRIALVPFKENIVAKYTFTQDESIMDQLIHGARYLDFRISKHDDGFWFNHGIARIRPVDDSIREIKEFLNNTEEIVIIDFHRFLFGASKLIIHEEFASYLRKEFKAYAASPSLGWSASLNDIWRSKKRLILAYNDEGTVRNHSDFLWSGVSQQWGDVRNVIDLKSYIKSKIYAQFDVMWSIMAELTPDIWSVLLDKEKGLRKMADAVSHPVTEWFRGKWGNKCNAVAVDFIRSTAIVEDAIKWNKRKAAGSVCDKSVNSRP